MISLGGVDGKCLSTFVTSMSHEGSFVCLESIASDPCVFENDIPQRSGIEYNTLYGGG